MLQGVRRKQIFKGGSLPRQLTHHLQQSLVLLFQLLVLILDVIQVLRKKGKTGLILSVLFKENIHNNHRTVEAPASVK